MAAANVTPIKTAKPVSTAATGAGGGVGPHHIVDPDAGNTARISTASIDLHASHHARTGSGGVMSDPGSPLDEPRHTHAPGESSLFQCPKCNGRHTRFVISTAPAAGGGAAATSSSAEDMPILYSITCLSYNCGHKWLGTDPEEPTSPGVNVSGHGGGGPDSGANSKSNTPVLPTRAVSYAATVPGQNSDDTNDLVSPLSAAMASAATTTPQKPAAAATAAAATAPPPFAITIRPGQKSDAPVLLHLIRALATYEKENADTAVVVTQKQLEEDGWGQKPVFKMFLAEITSNIAGAGAKPAAGSGGSGAAGGKTTAVGFALYFTAYSTWTGACTYLEDLFVQPEYRRYGIGLKLIRAVVADAQKQNHARVMWQVLSWNQLALGFYKEKLDAEILRDWIPCRMDRKSMAKFLASNQGK